MGLTRNTKTHTELWIKSVVRRDIGECWEYLGCDDGSGYPQAYIGQKRARRVHALMYEKEIGNIPAGHILHHKCQNRWCVNPYHLIPIKRTEHTKVHKKQFCKRGHLLPEQRRSGRGIKIVCTKCYEELQENYKGRKDAEKVQGELG